MKLICQFSVKDFSNTYIVAPDEGGKAIVVDPGCFNVALLKVLEKNKLMVDSVLVTHSHASHVGGLKTLMKVYTPTVYAYIPSIYETKTTRVQDGERFQASGFEVLAMKMEGHSLDSLAFRIGSYLFTGDSLEAGRFGSTLSKPERTTLVSTIYERIFSIEDELLIFPGHGPPTTLRAEKELTIENGTRVS